MGLYDGSTERQNYEKRKKLKNMIVVTIAILCLLIFIIIGLIIYLADQPKSISLALDGEYNNELLQELLIDIDEETGEIKVDKDGNPIIYAPIKRIAKYFDYKDNNGNYMDVSEDTNSCNVRNDKEVAIFTLDSDIVYKKDLTNNSSNYEKYTLGEKVFKENEDLYTNIEGLKKAFNIDIFYTPKTNVITIYTLDYYISYYITEDPTTQTTILQDIGYTSLDDTFVNQKAILDGMLVVKDEMENYGVINLEGKKLFSTQYDSLTYMPESEAFLIQSNEKFGVISVTGETKIKPIYEDIQLIDSEKQLYLILENSKYGVIDINSNFIVPVEYDKIGIDNISQFNENKLTNRYIIQDTLIPVEQNQKWGFYDVNTSSLIGEGIAYNTIGCVTKNIQGKPILLIPECNAIIVSKNQDGKDNKYGCIDFKGETLIGFRGDDAYIQVISNETQYFITRIKDGQREVINIVESLNQN